MNIQPSLIEKQVIAYYRRSQDKRGQRHSIDAQRIAVQGFCEANNLRIAAEYQDTASGKVDAREGLLQAVAAAKSLRIPLVVLRVDRLGRKLSTLASYFEDSSLTIYVAELGMQADFLTLSILSAVSAANVRTLSNRTKEGLRAARAAGVKLGNPSPERSLALCKESNLARGQATVDKYGDIIKNLRETGLSYPKIATELSKLGIPTPSGRGSWTHGTVRRIYTRSK